MEKNKTIIDYLLYTLVTINIIILLYFGYKKLSDREFNILNGINNAEINSYVVNIDLNGADRVDTKKLNCAFNDNDTCTVHLPNAYRDNGKVMGFSTDKDSNIPDYLMDTDIELSKDMILYVISYRVNTLHIEENDIDYLASNDLSCIVYNDADVCRVKIPIYNKVGYENKGYSTSKESLAGFVYPNDYYELSKDVTLYPIYATSSRHKPISVNKTIIVNNSFVEIESGCSSSLYPTYIGYLNDIKVMAPYLLFGNKISLIGDTAFNDIWGSGYVGMNYGPRKLRAIDIRCSNAVYNDYYATMVHELGHSWDYYYSTKSGDNITSQSDVINLFNKYNSMSNKPFRSYSYTNIYEFFADAVKYYYFKYLKPVDEYARLSYPSDIKEVLEKYICIANNDYDESKCDI